MSFVNWTRLVAGAMSMDMSPTSWSSLLQRGGKWTRKIRPELWTDNWLYYYSWQIYMRFKTIGKNLFALLHAVSHRERVCLLVSLKFIYFILECTLDHYNRTAICLDTILLTFCFFSHVVKKKLRGLWLSISSSGLLVIIIMAYKWGKGVT